MKNKGRLDKTLVYLVSTLAITLWGMSYIWTDKLIALGIPIFYFVFVRIFLAGIILLIFNVLSGKIVPIRKKDIPIFLLLALCEPFIYFIFETYGLKETGSPTISAMVIATIPIFSIAAGLFFFKEKINAIQGLLNEVEPYEQCRVEKIKERIYESLQKVEGLTVDNNRFEQELIFYIEKLDITEEKLRLQNHLDYFLQTIANATSEGKKLGFIAQEMGREINTMGSKANHAELQKVVVDMKDHLEQIKEQVLNAL